MEELGIGFLDMYVTIIDTYPDFKEIVFKVKTLGENIVDLWLNNYMRKREELFSP